MLSLNKLFALTMLRNVASSIALAFITFIIANYFLFVASGINSESCLFTSEVGGVTQCVGLLSFLPSIVQFIAFLFVVASSVFGGIDFYRKLTEVQKQQERNEEEVKRIRN